MYFFAIRNVNPKINISKWTTANFTNQAVFSTDDEISLKNNTYSLQA